MTVVHAAVLYCDPPCFCDSGGLWIGRSARTNDREDNGGDELTAHALHGDATPTVSLLGEKLTIQLPEGQLRAFMNAGGEA